MVSRSNSSRLLALLVGLSAAPLAGQAPGTSAPVRLSFADAVNLATGKTPVVELATLRTTEADARVRQARAAPLPALAGGGARAQSPFHPRPVRGSVSRGPGAIRPV